MPDIDFTKYPNVNFRLGGHLNTALSARGDSLNVVAKRDLERYYDVLAASLPTFAMNEALLLCDCLNGVRCTPDSLWANIAASDEFCSSEKWEVEPGPFLERIKALSYVEAQAAIDAVERVWNVREYGMVDLSKRVLLVGLVK